MSYFTYGTYWDLITVVGRVEHCAPLLYAESILAYVTQHGIKLLYVELRKLDYSILNYYNIYFAGAISIRDQKIYMNDQNLDADDFSDIRHYNFHQIAGRSGSRNGIAWKDLWN